MYRSHRFCKCPNERKAKAQLRESSARQPRQSCQTAHHQSLLSRDLMLYRRREGEAARPAIRGSVGREQQEGKSCGVIKPVSPSSDGALKRRRVHRLSARHSALEHLSCRHSLLLPAIQWKASCSPLRRQGRRLPIRGRPTNSSLPGFTCTTCSIQTTSTSTSDHTKTHFDE